MYRSPHRTVPYKWGKPSGVPHSAPDSEGGSSHVFKYPLTSPGAWPSAQPIPGAYVRVCSRKGRRTKTTPQLWDGHRSPREAAECTGWPGDTRCRPRAPRGPSPSCFCRNRKEHRARLARASIESAWPVPASSVVELTQTDSRCAEPGGL